MPPLDKVPGQSSVLDAPPPSPQAQGGGPTGQMPSMSGLAAPAQIPSGGLPPEILTGMMDAAVTVGATLDALAQTAPDLAMEFGLVKDMLQRVMSKLLTAGSGAIPSTSPAPGGFPGGGLGNSGPVSGA